MRIRRIVLALMMCLSIAGLVVLAVPKAASADVYPYTWQWTDSTYKGYDDFYGSTVVAYTENSTAKLAVNVANYYNYEYGDATIKSATLKMDWGTDYSATSIPSDAIPYGKSATINFSFTVPSISTATNAVLHSYVIEIEYQTQGYSYVVNFEPWDSLGNGNDVNTVFYLYYPYYYGYPMAPDSQTLYLVNSTAGTVTAVSSSAYDIDAYTGKVTFHTAPASGTAVYAKYTYLENEGLGDGINKVFYTNDSPVKPDSESIYLKDTVTKKVTTKVTDYTFDDDTGKIVLGTAPAPYQYVEATYEGYGSSSWIQDFGGHNFAVYSAGQAASRTLYGQWYDLRYVLDYSCAAATELVAESDAAENAFEVALTAGNFAEANTQIQSAVTNLQAALTAQTAFDKAAEDRDIAHEGLDNAQVTADTAYTTALTANVAKEGALIDAEAGKADSYGTFFILIGVAGILVSVSALVWSASKIMHRPSA